VETAISSAQQQNTVVVANDTDILILLIHYKHSNTSHNIWLQSPSRKDSKKPSKCWNIWVTRQTLRHHVSNHLLFAHVLLGCDTTSRVFGIGKHKAVTKLIKKDKIFQTAATKFMSRAANANDVKKSGSSALIAMYNGGENDCLDDLRYQKFCEKTARSTIAVVPCSLPPTSSAAKFHSFRVYQQVQVWLGHENDVPQEQWGWHVNEGRLLPTMTEMSPAPSQFLEMIVCNCKTGCATLRCTCRRSGLECTMACGECHGSCSNASVMEESDSDEDTDDIAYHG